MSKTKGTVRWFNTKKGYGFIAPEDEGGDIFVHISAVTAAGLAQLSDNQKIVFKIETDNKGRRSAVDLETDDE